MEARVIRTPRIDRKIEAFMAEYPFNKEPADISAFLKKLEAISFSLKEFPNSLDSAAQQLLVVDFYCQASHVLNAYLAPLAPRFSKQIKPDVRLIERNSHFKPSDLFTKCCVKLDESLGIAWQWLKYINNARQHENRKDMLLMLETALRNYRKQTLSLASLPAPNKQSDEIEAELIFKPDEDMCDQSTHSFAAGRSKSEEDFNKALKEQKAGKDFTTNRFIGSGKNFATNLTVNALPWKLHTPAMRAAVDELNFFKTAQRSHSEQLALKRSLADANLLLALSTPERDTKRAKK